MKVFNIKIGLILLLFLLAAYSNCKKPTEQSKPNNSLQNFRAKCPESECGEYKMYVLPSDPKVERPSCDVCDSGCDTFGSNSTWCKGCRKNCDPFPKHGGGGDPQIPIFCFVYCDTSTQPAHCQELCH